MIEEEVDEGVSHNHLNTMKPQRVAAHKYVRGKYKKHSKGDENNSVDEDTNDKKKRKSDKRNGL